MFHRKPTKETWYRAAEAVLEVRPVLRFEPGLYHASAEQMLQLLRTASASTVMMIGHNPGIAELAGILPATAPMDPDFRRYPTGATLVLDFQSDGWSEINPGEGSVRDFVRLDGRG